MVESSDYNLRWNTILFYDIHRLLDIIGYLMYMICAQAFGAFAGRVYVISYV